MKFYAFKIQIRIRTAKHRNVKLSKSSNRNNAVGVVLEPGWLSVSVYLFTNNYKLYFKIQTYKKKRLSTGYERFVLFVTQNKNLMDVT